jgi:putative membrane protein
MLRLLLQWVFSAVSLTIVSKLLPGFRIKNFSTALAVAAVYGILHLLLYRLLAILAFFPMLLTFGLFGFVINALLLFVAYKLVDDFIIESMATTLVAAVILTILNGIWYRLLL